MNMREFADAAEQITAEYQEAVDAANKEFSARIEEARQTRRGQMNQALAEFRGDRPPETVAEAEMDYGYRPRHEARR